MKRIHMGVAANFAHTDLADNNAAARIKKISDGDLSELIAVEGSIDQRMRLLKISDDKTIVLTIIRRDPENNPQQVDQIILVTTVDANDAEEYARNHTVRANPVSGVLEVISAEFLRAEDDTRKKIDETSTTEAGESATPAEPVDEVAPAPVVEPEEDDTPYDTSSLPPRSADYGAPAETAADDTDSVEAADKAADEFEQKPAAIADAAAVAEEQEAEDSERDGHTAELAEPAESEVTADAVDESADADDEPSADAGDAADAADTTEPAAGADVSEPADGAAQVTDSETSAAVDGHRQLAEVGAIARKTNVGVRLVADGYTPEILFKELGLNPLLSQQVMETTTHLDLLRVLATAPVWQAEAFKSLCVGVSIEQVREELKLGDAPDSSRSEEDQLLDAGNQPASRMEFAYAQDAATLREIIESGDFAAWRTYLHPSQEKLATRWFSGPARVFGGAGTGKTVVAVHRARNIARGELAAKKNGHTGNRIILTTYTRGLSRALKKMLSTLDPELNSQLVEHPGEDGIYVGGIDQIASFVLRHVQATTRIAATEKVFGQAQAFHPKTMNENEELRMLSLSLDLTDPEPTGVLTGVQRTSLFLLTEWNDVVLANRVRTAAEYLACQRDGKRPKLNRKQRLTVWKVLDHFRRTCLMDGKVGWTTQAAFAAAIIDEQVNSGELSESRYADHVVIDESQDFHAGHWLLIRALVPEGANDIFLAEDAHQRIYGRPLVLQRFNIPTRGRSSGLKINYRTTAENLEYANERLIGENYTDSDGEKVASFCQRSLRTGPEPQIIEAGTFPDLMATAIKLIEEWQRSASATKAVQIGILCREKADFNRIMNALTKAKIEARESKDAENIPEGEVALLTMHSSKGLEFTHVILLDPERYLDEADRRYGLANQDDTTRALARQRERSLIYVASSRARDELVVLNLKRHTAARR